MRLKAVDPDQQRALLELIGQTPPLTLEAELSLGQLQQLEQLVRSPLWPEAVPVAVIVPDQDEEAKRERAQAILGAFACLQQGQRFLDYGCGQGHCAVLAAGRAQLSRGYDLEPQGWERHGDVGNLLTTDWAEVQAAGPYDLILLYDVLDCCSDPAQVLDQVKSVLAPGGKIRLRCHPFCAIHGGHSYLQHNRAYAQLLLPGLAGQDRQRVLTPLRTYNAWVAAAGLHRLGDPAVSEVTLPELVRDPAVLARLLQLWVGDEFVTDHSRLEIVLKIGFVDYWLAAQ